MPAGEKYLTLLLRHLRERARRLTPPEGFAEALRRSEREMTRMPKGMRPIPKGMHPEHPLWQDYLEAEAERLRLQEELDKAINPEQRRQLEQLIFKGEPKRGRRAIDWIYTVTPEGKVEALHPKTREPAHLYVMREVIGIPRPWEYKTRLTEGGKVQAYRERLPLVSRARARLKAAETRRKRATEIAQALREMRVRRTPEGAVEELIPSGEKVWQHADKRFWRELAKSARAKDPKEYFLRWWGKRQQGGEGWYQSNQAKFRPREAMGVRKAEERLRASRKPIEEPSVLTSERRGTTLTQRAQRRPVIREVRQLLKEKDVPEPVKIHLQRWLSEMQEGTHPLDAYKEVLKYFREEEGAGTFARKAQEILMKYRRLIGLPALGLGALGLELTRPDEAEAAYIPKGIPEYLKSKLTEGFRREGLHELAKFVSKLEGERLPSDWFEDFLNILGINLQEDYLINRHPFVSQRVYDAIKRVLKEARIPEDSVQRFGRILTKQDRALEAFRNYFKSQGKDQISWGELKGKLPSASHTLKTEGFQPRAKVALRDIEQALKSRSPEVVGEFGEWTPEAVETWLPGEADEVLKVNLRKGAREDPVEQLLNKAVVEGAGTAHPGGLLWIRYKDVTVPDGRKVRVIHEIQSDVQRYIEALIKDLRNLPSFKVSESTSKKALKRLERYRIDALATLIKDAKEKGIDRVFVPDLSSMPIGSTQSKGLYDVMYKRTMSKLGGFKKDELVGALDETGMPIVRPTLRLPEDLPDRDAQLLRDVFEGFQEAGGVITPETKEEVVDHIVNDLIRPHFEDKSIPLRNTALRFYKRLLNEGITFEGVPKKGYWRSTTIALPLGLGLVVVDEREARAEERPLTMQELVDQGIVEPKDIVPPEGLEEKSEVVKPGEATYPFDPFHPERKPVDVKQLSRTMKQYVTQQELDNMSLKYGLVKGVTGPMFFTPGYKETMDFTKERLEDMYKQLGIEPKPYVEQAGEIIGEFAPITMFMGAARWTIGALRWSPNFWNKFITTGAYGAAYEWAKGRAKTPEEVAKEAALWGGLEVLPYVPKAISFPFRLVGRYMKNRDKFADRIIKTAWEVIEGQRGVGPLRIPQPKDFGRLIRPWIEDFGETWREWLQPALYRMEPKVRRMFRDYYRNLGIHKEEALGLAERIVTGKNLEKGIEPLNSYERQKLYEYFAERFKIAKTPTQAYKELRQHVEGIAFWSERAQARSKVGVLADLPADRRGLIKRYAKDINKYMTHWGQEATKAGWKKVKGQIQPLMSVWTFQRNAGAWLGRYYKTLDAETVKKLEDVLRTPLTDRNSFRKTEMLRLDLSRFMRRHDLSKEAREALGEVVDAGEVAYQSLVDITRDVETARLFQTIHNMKNVFKTPREFRQAVKNVPTFDGSRWVRVPVTEGPWAKYGVLEGGYLHRDVWLELKSFIDPIQESVPLLREAMQLWKFGKVVARPSTHFRNMMSNVILNHLGGMPLYSPRSLESYIEALRVIRNPEKHKAMWEEMRDVGVFTGAFGAEELRALKAVRLENVKNVGELVGTLTSKLARKGARLYTLEEHWAKAAKYLHNVKYRGMSSVEAAEDAVKSTFHYGEITPFIRRVRTSPLGFPFVTFTYKAIPYIMETTIRAPWRIAGLMSALWLGAQASLETLNITDEEWKDLRKRLPGYVKNGAYLPLPWRDSQGRLQLLDLTYILPWGDFYEVLRAGGEEGRLGIGRFIFANPLFTTAYELAFNKNYAGQPIRHDWEPTPIQAFKVFNHIWKAAVPSIFIGGYDFMKVYNLLFEEQREYEPTAKQVLASQFGLKTFARTEEQVARVDYARRQEQERELWSQVYREYRGGAGLSERAVRRAQDRLRRIWAVED